LKVWVTDKLKDKSESLAWTNLPSFFLQAHRHLSCSSSLTSLQAFFAASDNKNFTFLLFFAYKYESRSSLLELWPAWPRQVSVSRTEEEEGEDKRRGLSPKRQQPATSYSGFGGGSGSNSVPSSFISVSLSL
jgi:hypothetical protein